MLILFLWRCPVENSFEHSNEHPGSTKGREFFEQLGDYQFQKESAVWSWSVYGGYLLQQTEETRYD
jgi:hypothetical protein